MGRIISYRFDWQDFHEPYTIHCQKCGKALHRTISDGCNHLADTNYIANLKQRLKERAAELEEKTKETCPTCIRKEVGALDDYEFLDLHKYIGRDKSVTEEIKTLRSELNSLAKHLTNSYKNHIVIYKDCEWVVDRFDYCIFNEQLMASVSRVNKSQPWKLTIHHEYVPISAVKLTDRSFTEREERANL